MTIGFLLGLFSIFLSDTIPTSTDAILETAFSDLAYTSLEERNSFYQQNSNHVSYLDHMELRTRSRNFDPREQMFRFRTYTNSPSERKYSREYLSATYTEQNLDKKAQLNTLLKQRYRLIAASFIDKKKMMAMEELGILLGERRNVLEKSIDNIDFDFQDLLKAEEDYDHFLLESIDVERKFQQHEEEIRNLLGTEQTVGVSQNDFVSVSDIRVFLSQFEYDLEQNNFYYERQKLDKQLAELDYLGSRASKRNPVKFFEASYRDVPGEGFRRDLAIGIGFRIPLGSAGKGGLLDRQFKLMKEENMLSQLSVELKEEIRQTIINLQTLLKKHQALSGMIDNDLQQRSLEKYREIDGISPLILLKIRENILSKHLLATDLELDILYEYIELLDISGMLVREPFINYFNSSEDFY
ncbi:TolC family protein [Pleomorphovibrio marinus]|uniref:hypothetical protein n=1 Tax=Pleomorphovibrio marinus TaxID=2164132 RepID=UPI000E09F2C6|nr:hypothetical protein [Pleomorphovibrio marinus]